MENLYIKFEEWNQESLDRAIKEAEKLGYVKAKCYSGNPLWFEWHWILELYEDWTYFTSIHPESSLIDDYEEHIMEDQIKDQFEVWEIVEIKVREVYKKYKYLANIMNNIIVTDDLNSLLDCTWLSLFIFEKSRVRKLPKTIKITTDDWQILEISKDKAVDLGFKVS